MFESIISSIFNFLMDMVVNLVGTILGAILYYLELAVAQGVAWLYESFEVLSGLKNISYQGQSMQLIRVFTDPTTLGGSMVTKVYWSMAVIGMVLAFGFAIAAVIKKSFDLNSENKLTYGKILTNLFKSILIVILMSSAISVVVNGTTVLLKSITTAFKEANSQEARTVTVKFDDEDYMDMARIMDTIAGYSMNPSYNSRYNINSCYNDIRPDLVKLYNKGLFNHPYQIKEDGRVYWQYSILQLINSVDLDKEQAADEYNDVMGPIIEDIMSRLRSDSSFKPLSSYTYVLGEGRVAGEIQIDRMALVIGTLGAARNDRYNGKDMGPLDSLRAPYVYGDKNIYNPVQVGVDFTTRFGVGGWNHFTVAILLLFLAYSFLGIAFNAAARIFNMLFLYLILPFAASTLPYDDGAKMKQWTTAFIIQSFSFFGTIIAMQLFVILLPVLYDSQLVFADNILLNWFIKSLMVIAFGFATSRASSLLTGILAENAAYESLRAGDIADSARRDLWGLGGKMVDFGKWTYGKATGGKKEGEGKKQENKNNNNSNSTEGLSNLTSSLPSKADSGQNNNSAADKLKNNWKGGGGNAGGTPAGHKTTDDVPMNRGSLKLDPSGVDKSQVTKTSAGGSRTTDSLGRGRAPSLEPLDSKNSGSGKGNTKPGKGSFTNHTTDDVAGRHGAPGLEPADVAPRSKEAGDAPVSFANNQIWKDGGFGSDAGANADSGANADGGDTPARTPQSIWDEGFGSDAQGNSVEPAEPTRDAESVMSRGRYSLDSDAPDEGPNAQTNANANMNANANANIPGNEGTQGSASSNAEGNGRMTSSQIRQRRYTISNPRRDNRFTTGANKGDQNLPKKNK